MTAVAPRKAPASTGLGFVVCPSYHGATLLSLLLNNHSGISALGDTNPTRAYDQRCACGARVSECPFWQTVSDRLDVERFAHLGTMLPTLAWPLENNHLEGGPTSTTSNAAVNRAIGHGAASVADAVLPLIWRRNARPLAEYVEPWTGFYDLVRELHGTSLVIDGSKGSRKVALMAKMLDDTAVKVIHLVRDPRGYVASNLRYHPDRELRTTTWLWADLHRRMASLSSSVPYLRVRYEDLVRQPELQMAAIFDFLGVPREAVIAAPRYPEKHHLMGNAMLFTFDGTVTVDERWRETLSPEHQRSVLRYAGATARRFGYAS